MNRLLKYLTLKNMVAVSLIASGTLIILILFTGLVLGTSTLDKLSKNKTVSTGEKADPSIVGLDGTNENGDKITTEVSSDDSASGAGPGGSTSSTSPGSGGSTGSTTKPSGGGTTTPTNPGGGTLTPTITSFTASPSSVSYNSPSTLSWASANASSCTISTLGTVATSGSKSTGNLTNTKTFTLTCGTATKSVMVTVGSAPVACGQSGGVCTASQVAQHSSQGDCWVIYNGYYYIVTSYVNNHPGGTSVFNSNTCGKDIASYLNGTASTAGKDRKHSNNAYTILNSYRVGQVQG